ncbi:Crp/Fnr family transcriptional regulator [Marinoscillum furvescens]|uniref:CRP-like cAMP-binding protein n=1 Tax=Marinoscillum furvescens DSM 4134 TaxID=1122208 RepID=A0A3D9KZV7_MARFU|nr:Crp/Fnr family transcriptional regulator [Marinoscillum furvescens]RED93655.1 CRP-like cAMP-binding protein [Marinoscillum furvescens DSM 4134]
MNAQELILQNFKGYVQEGDAPYEYLMTHFCEYTYDSRQLIVEGGAIARHFYFVLEGVQAIYVISRTGEKVVLGFSFDGSVSGVYDSFIYQKPSAYFLEALTPSRMLGISIDRFNELFERFPDLLKWRVTFVDAIMEGRGRREVEMLTLSAAERYEAFVKRCPPELLTIPQKYLASYLHMKPETFSRLRKNASSLFS